MRHLGRMPAEGESFDYSGYRIQIVDLDGYRIDKLLLMPLVPEATSAESPVETESAEPSEPVPALLAGETAVETPPSPASQENSPAAEGSSGNRPDSPV
jgi:hypothetical protein